MLDLDKIGTKHTNGYYPFTKEEFFNLHKTCAWGAFAEKFKQRNKEIKELKAEMKKSKWARSLK